MPAPSGASVRLLALFLVIVLHVSSAWAGRNDVAETMEVQPDPDGGLHATATVHLPAPRSVVQQVLTDYERWGSLFGVSMRLVKVERLPGRVVTDVYISHPILPGESRLLCESRELPEGGLVTSLIEGDFNRYVRTWRLTDDADTATTTALFDLVVDVKTWAPDWLIEIELKRQLTRHFGILRDTVAARMAAH